MGIFPLRGWLKHPYVNSAVLLVLIMLSAGGVRWWGWPTVILRADGTARKVHPSAATVGELLAAEQVQLGPEDLCTPPLDTPLRRNTVIRVTRVTHRIDAQIINRPPQITHRVQLKTNLRPVLVERGFLQETNQKVRTTHYDGVQTARQVLSRKVQRRPVFTLTLFHPTTGRPVKTYDLTKAKKLTMRATGYYVGEKYVPSDTTYLGYKLRRGLVAVDPKTIPLRSRLYVKGYGYAYAADTGSAIKGNRIDLAVKGKKEEIQFNRKKMEVYILERARKW